MKLWTASLNQMAFLMLLIVIGYILVRLGVVEAKTGKILSKLETNLFMPALVAGAFIERLTVHTVKTSWQYMLTGAILISCSILLAFPLALPFSKDGYERKIYTYGFAFSNFGFMGNAVVSALFPDLFMHYLLFTLPFQVPLYVWAVPNLLIPSKDGTKGIAGRMKTLLNPMTFSVFIGAAIGLSSLPVPEFAETAITTLGNCMSPIAMLLTGMTVAGMDLKKLFLRVPVYFASVIRLLVLPIAGILILKVLNIPYDLSLCAVCALAMPLGLNTIVIPEAYGKDTALGSSMALISHLMSCLTIPLVFYLFETLIH